VVAAEGPILDLSNSAQMRGASTVRLSQLPDDTHMDVMKRRRPVRR
jgi:hypothetical protein